MHKRFWSGLTIASWPIAWIKSQWMAVKNFPTAFWRPCARALAPVLISAVRAWMSYCITQTAQGKKLKDPLAEEIAKSVNSAQPERMLLQLIGAEDLAPLILE